MFLPPPCYARRWRNKPGPSCFYPVAARAPSLQSPGEGLKYLPQYISNCAQPGCAHPEEHRAFHSPRPVVWLSSSVKWPQPERTDANAQSNARIKAAVTYCFFTSIFLPPLVKLFIGSLFSIIFHIHFQRHRLYRGRFLFCHARAAFQFSFVPLFKLARQAPAKRGDVFLPKCQLLLLLRIRQPICA